ncbi:hypothetical protein B0F90DRAFT_1807545 [Multifurca ochricompacta]|uniref:Amidohydrolase-related domain-containing protein n=1 Tax=Multifurca ochricompacta TaxID=376703 RepID=A0AAD4QUN3_9AGAM|nr:hypothetical protein B0F90DRAFT_1807545 [Multifurca ochricompacta]
MVKIAHLALAELTRVECPNFETAQANAGSFLEEWNAVQEHDFECPIQIYAGHIFDSEAATFLPHRVLTVSEASGLIIDVQAYDPLEIEANTAKLFVNSNVIDLRSQTVLPGFVDAHVHLFLHPYSETSWEDQLTKESLAERTIRATVHAKRTLLAGFTTVRDLGTEGAGDADIALRKMLSGPSPLIPGPRYFCANRAIVSTGSYGPKGSLVLNKEGIDGITGAEVTDGVEGCRQAVRRQIGAGADWIKVFLHHYRIRSRVAPTSFVTARTSMSTFSLEEIKVMVDTAHRAGVKVAVHTQDKETINTILTSPELEGFRVDSLEHGINFEQPHDADRRRWDVAPASSAKPVIWVPTLSAFYTSGRYEGGPWASLVNAFRAALRDGFEDIACGGDTGVFAHGDNALELCLMVALGASPVQVLRWATFGGGLRCRYIATSGDLQKYFNSAVHKKNIIL